MIEMTVFSSNNQTRRREVVEHVAVLAITVVALLGPALLLSIAVASFGPLYVIAGTGVLGGIIGTATFLFPNDNLAGGDILTRALHGAASQVAGKRLLNAH